MRKGVFRQILLLAGGGGVGLEREKAVVGLAGSVCQPCIVEGASGVSKYIAL
jgi:hypothetical protein